MENALYFFKVLLSISALVAVVASTGLADDLIPATSEDISQFDAQLSKEREKQKKDNFGQKVSAEAKRLNAQGEKKEGFGQWVKSQHQREDQGRPAKVAPGLGGKGGDGVGGGQGVGGGVGGGAGGSNPGQGHGKDKDKGKKK